MRTDSDRIVVHTMAPKDKYAWVHTGGAQALAGLGVDPLRIQAMGRWRSALVIRYSGARGSAGITRDTARGMMSLASGSNSAPAQVSLDLAIVDCPQDPASIDRNLRQAMLPRKTVE